MTIRKHIGINQQTGKLKKGFKYKGRLKSGLSKIIKVKSKKGGGFGFKKPKPQPKPPKDHLTFDENVTIKEQPFNDCPREFRISKHRIIDDEGKRVKLWKCPDHMEEFITKNSIPCCKKKDKFNITLADEPTSNEDTKGKSRLKNPQQLKNLRKVKDKYISFQKPIYLVHKEIYPPIVRHRRERSSVTPLVIRNNDITQMNIEQLQVHKKVLQKKLHNAHPRVREIYKTEIDKVNKILVSGGRCKKSTKKNKNKKNKNNKKSS